MSETEPTHHKSDEVTPLLPRQRKGSWENDAKISAKKPSPWYIIVPTFALTFCFGALYAPMIEFYTIVFCNRYYQSKTGDSGDIPLENCAIPEVQSIVSEAVAIITFLTYGSTLLVAGYYGALSDRKGRRIVLGISSLGSILLFIAYILTFKFPNIFGISLLFIIPVVRGLMAGDSILIATANAYITDCTTPSQRTIAFGNMLACIFLGTTLGPAFAGYLIKQTGSILSVFYLVLAMSIFFELYIIFFLPESHDFVHFKPVDKKENQSFLQRINVFSALQVLFRSSTKHANRYALPLIAGSQFFISIVALPPIILYAMLKFHWTSYESGLFVSLSSLCKLIMLVALLPFLSKLFHKNKASLDEDDILPGSKPIIEEFIEEAEGSNTTATADVEVEDEQLSEKDIRHTIIFDSWMFRFGMAADVIAFTFLGLANTSKSFTLTIVLQSFGILAIPSLRSLTTTLVAPNEIGEVMGAMAVVESCAMIVSQLTLNTIYSASVSKMPELVFYVCSGIITIPLICAFFVKPAPLSSKSQNQA